MIRINEIFESIQGEGKYAGHPALFIRTSGCNLSCNFCDTKYHVNGEDISTKDLVTRIKASKPKIVVWTGGEPLLQFKDGIEDVIAETRDKFHQLETNGELLQYAHFAHFGYICCSPKSSNTTATVWDKFNMMSNFDIKLVIDHEGFNSELIPFATMLMPLTTFDPETDKLNQKYTWAASITYNKKFCLRQHQVVWEGKKGV